MDEARLKVLTMLSEGKINAEQAEGLLRALEGQASPGAVSASSEGLGKLGAFLAGVFGSGFGFAGSGRAVHQRKETLSAPMARDAVLAARIHNGPIVAKGADCEECTMDVTINARAATPEEARDLADRVVLDLVPSGETVALTWERPNTAPGQSIGLSLTATVPSGAGAQLQTHNGPVSVYGLSGALELTTHNGPIEAKAVGSTVAAHTHNGPLSVTCAAGAPSACDISLTTHNGGIEFVGPADMSAQVDAQTHNGAVASDLAISAETQNRRRLKGTVGAGEGTLRVKTHNGDVHLRQAVCAAASSA
jgi:hypothetical protein